MTEPTKAGARNNADDRRRIREMRGAAKRIADITVEMEPDDDDPQEGEDCEKPVKAEMVISLPEITLQWVSVKAGADEWTLDVLGVPFGGPFDGKDHDKQYFDASTKIYNDFYQTIPAVYGHGAEPTGRRAAKPAIVGKATYQKQDERGHWYKVILDRASEYARRLWDAAKAGRARASSGSMAHMVRFGNGGHIDEWPVTEMTLVDIETSNLKPANPYAVALPALKAVYEAAGMELRENQPEAAAGVKATGAADNHQHLTGVIEMDEKELLELLDKRDAAKAAANAEAQKAAEVETLRKENEAFKAKIAEMQRLPGGTAKVAQWADTRKYDHLTTDELALVVASHAAFHAKASDKIGPVPAAALKALGLKAARIDEEKLDGETSQYIKANVASVYGDVTDDAIKAATDPAYSTLSNAGAEWVGTLYGAQLWNSIRADLKVIANIPTDTIPDGYASKYWPLESTDPTWYTVAQATASDATMGVPVPTVTASQMGTAQKQLTVGTAGARCLYTGMLDENSLIAYVPQLRKQLVVSGREMMEHVAIDGDTDGSATTNINDIGGTPAVSDMFMLTNGFRKLALITGAATQAKSAAGGFVAENYLDALERLGVNGKGYADPTKCALIVDPKTYRASAKLPEAKDKNNTIFDVRGGFVQTAYLTEVMQSFFMHYRSAVLLANSAGKVDQDTTANNAYGSILGVRWDQWKLAFKRVMTMETTRIANADSWEIVALTRWGLGARDNYAASIVYYVGV